MKYTSKGLLLPEGSEFFNVDHAVQNSQKTDDLIVELEEQNKNLEANKTNVADIVQTTEVNSSTKYPSSAVTYGLQQTINGMFNELADIGSGADLNEQITSGFMRVTSAGTINGFGELGTLIVFRKSTFIAQFLIGRLATKTRISVNSGTSWSNWI